MLASKRDTCAAQASEVSARLSRQEVEIISITKEIDGLRQMADQLRDQKLHQKEHVAGLERQRADYLRENAEIREKIAQAERRREDYAAQAAALGAEIEQKTQARNACEAKTTALRADEKEITARRETAVRELARLEEKKASLQAEYDGIISRLWDEYEITRTQASEIARPVEDAGRAQRRLGELKGKIRALGNVNVSAIEEYKEVVGAVPLPQDPDGRRGEVPRRAYEADYPAHERHAVDLRG